MFSEDTYWGENWLEAYYLAVVEVDAEKMPERIAAARHAIGERLQALGGDLDRTEEKERIGRSLRGLAFLEVEAQSGHLQSDRYPGFTPDQEQ